jgi:hypothetical protein
MLMLILAQELGMQWVFLGLALGKPIPPPLLVLRIYHFTHFLFAFFGTTIKSNLPEIDCGF